MTRPIIKVAFTGKMCSGKTTLASYLSGAESCTRLSFADAVRREALRLHGNMKRETLQFVGQTRRNADPDCWVKRLGTTMERLKINGMQNFVVDDLRYPNEATFLRKEGFTIIKLECPDVLRRARCLELGKSAAGFNVHPSETEVDHVNADYTLDTSQSYKYTIRELNGILEEIKAKEGVMNARSSRLAAH